MAVRLESPTYFFAEVVSIVILEFRATVTDS
jgi:hypothetical protein